jgi:acyl-CoA thioester hydrolase
MVSPQQPGAWFEYLVRVQPHHTDYAGVVWHGSYLQWMEEARIAAFREVGVEFADLVQLGCDLPVTELSIQYHQPLTMGAIAIVKSRIRSKTKVRMYWDQHIYAPETPTPCVTTTLTLVPVNRAEARIIRQLPAQVQVAIEQIMAPSRGT